MSGHIALGCVLLVVLIFAVDWLIGTFEKYRQRRDEFIRNTEIDRYNMGAFRGTRDWRDL